MKKLMTLLVIATITFFACNDHKDPPDEQFIKYAQADSLIKVDSLKRQ